MTPATLECDSVFEAFLEHLKQEYRFNFNGYKRASLMRRIQTRMQQISIESYQVYQEYLDTHSGEFSCLFDTIEINHTEFFRDPSEWNYLRSEIIPRICDPKSSDQPVRVWSAGCATGEEAYTLASIFAEAIGREQFRQRVRIFATDVDAEAIRQARQGSYSEARLAHLPEELRSQFFQLVNDHYIFSKDLRPSVVFHQHNLLEAPPLSKIDLLVCRNTLIYFNCEAQTRTLSRFYFSLQDDGFLFLGRSEMVLHQPVLFKAVHPEHHVFVKESKEQFTPKAWVKAFKKHY